MVVGEIEGFLRKEAAGRWQAATREKKLEEPAGEALASFIQPFPPTGAKYQVSSSTGRAPVWSPDGKQLFFHQSASNALFVVDVHPAQGLTFGTPLRLPIDGTIHPQLQRNYDVTLDGTDLVVVLPA